MNKQIIQHALDGLETIEEGTFLDDLHHILFNENYFIIGTYESKQFLEEEGVFNVIGEIKDYEQDRFGEVLTDLSSPEALCQMYCYIKGEELILQIYNSVSNRLTEKDLIFIEDFIKNY
tara:strand:+ start:366 stop:722 length:357 start_codon:yes stop_codon:yes gene_type:complete